MNRYQYARLLGVALAVLGVGVLALTYPPPLALGAQAVLLVAAGVLHAISGTPSPLRERVGPHRLLGAGNIVLGASLAVSALGETGTGTGAELAYTVATALAGASLAFIGLAYIFRPGDFGLGPDGYPE